MPYENHMNARIAHIPVIYIEVALLLVLIFSYVGLAFHTVYAAGMKERAQRALVDFSSQIGTIETHYLELTKQITLDRANTLGFKENLQNTLFLNTNGKITASLPQGNEI